MRTLNFRLNASMPLIHRRAASFSFLAFFLLSPFWGIDAHVARLLPVTVVRLVVEHHDVPEVHQPAGDPLDHLPVSLDGPYRVALALKNGFAHLARLQNLAGLEGMTIRDDDFRSLHLPHHVGWDDLAHLVVAVGVVGLQFP